MDNSDAWKTHRRDRKPVPMETVPCDLCGSTRGEPWRQIRGWQIVRCPECGLAYLNPRPTADGLAELYSESYFQEGAIPIQPSRESLEPYVAEQSEKVLLLEEFLGPGRVLDVGCASGLFLECARRRGWEVVGVEISREAAKTAIEIFGLEVWTGNFNEIGVQGASFDAVTFWDSLEHVPSPTGAIRAALKCLAPDGFLFVRVPNMVSLDCYVYRESWLGWHVPFHFYYFTPRTLRDCLEHCGAKTVDLRFKLSTAFTKLVRPDAARRRIGKDVKVAAPIGHTPSGVVRGSLLGSLKKRLVWRVLPRVFSGRNITAIAARG